MIVDVGSLFHSVVERRVNQGGDVLVRERVKYVFAGAPSRHEVLCAKQAKLLRHRRESNACRFRQLRHAPLAFGEALKQPKTCLVTRRTKNRRCARKGMRGHFRSSFSAGVLFWRTMWARQSIHHFTNQ